MGRADSGRIVVRIDHQQFPYGGLINITTMLVARNKFSKHYRWANIVRTRGPDVGDGALCELRTKMEQDAWKSDWRMVTSIHQP